MKKISNSPLLIFPTVQFTILSPFSDPPNHFCTVPNLKVTFALNITFSLYY